MSLQIKRVVETLAAERAQVSLDVAMATDMTREQALQRKHFLAGAALELMVSGLQHYKNNNSRQTMNTMQFC